MPYEKVGKNEPVCIADEVPFDIPDSWEWVRLGSILSVISDGTHKTPHYVSEGVPFLSVQNISGGKFDFNIPISETDKSINQLALDIFEKGYDTRFQTAQAIPVFINELIVRLIYSVRRLFWYFNSTTKEERSFSLMWKKCEPFSNPTVKRMLTVAHGAFCLIDASDATIRAFVAGGGSFNPVEFFLRLNIVGVGRFAISLYGETKRAITYNYAKQEAEFAEKEKSIVENYIQGLKLLSEKYDDTMLLTFVSDFEKSRAYAEAFAKTVALAKMRDVPEDKILKNKADIDKFFSGGIK